MRIYVMFSGQLCCRRMDTSSIDCFLAIVRHGSTTKAAADLFLTQSSVSRRLQTLERYCGTALFDRSKSGMALTPAGATLVPIAAEMDVRNAEWWRAIADVHRSSAALRIACPTMVAEGLILPFIAECTSEIFDVVEVPTVDIYAALREHSADFAMAPLTPPVDMASRLLFKLPFTLQVPGNHPDAHRRSVELAEIVDYPILMADLRSGTRRAFEPVVARTGTPFTRIRNVSRTHIAQALAAAHRGVVISIDPPKYGLVSIAIHDHGCPIYCNEWAAWHPGHFATDAIGRTLDSYIEWARSRPEISLLAKEVDDS